MWRIQQQLTIILAAPLLLGMLLYPLPQVAADTTGTPSLVVSQLKITSSSGQFVTLYNTTDAPIDLTTYQLQYFNNYDISKATTSKVLSMNGSLPAHAYYMLTDATLRICSQVSISSVSLDFSTTAGFLQLLKITQATPSGATVPQLQDYVGWSKVAVSGVQTLPSNTAASLLRQPVNAAYNPDIRQPGAGTWQTVQPDPNDACGLITTTNSPTAVPTGMSQLLPSSEPPAQVVVTSEDIPAATIPAADIGLAAPTITELLPNPVGTGNDDTDEFIELYNANDRVFDLSGFSLQTGLTTKRTYTFPNGTVLQPRSFTALYADQTGLTLSNTKSQVVLRDPTGKTIATTTAYSSAKDGQAWALARGKWQWTITPTPNTTNRITAPVTSRAKNSAKSGKVTGAHKTTNQNTYTQATASMPNSPIHFTVLALVVAGAVLYGAYEYRNDVANRLEQFRRNRAARHADRRAPARR